MKIFLLIFALSIWINFNIIFFFFDYRNFVEITLKDISNCCDVRFSSLEI